jgi:hypothetical protein
MSDTQPIPGTGPAIPPRVRDVVYIVTLIVSALATELAILAAVLWDGPTALKVAAICGAITGVVGTICGGLGVAYRPSVTQREPYTARHTQP